MCNEKTFSGYHVAVLFMNPMQLWWPAHDPHRTGPRLVSFRILCQFSLCRPSEMPTGWIKPHSLGLAVQFPPPCHLLRFLGDFLPSLPFPVYWISVVVLAKWNYESFLCIFCRDLIISTPSQLFPDDLLPTFFFPIKTSLCCLGFAGRK